MINTIGKSLVAVNLAVSAVFFAMAAGVYFYQIDWGRREPIEDVGEFIPSELDKRVAAVWKQRSARGSGEAMVSAALSSYEAARYRWAENTRWAKQELATLENSPGDLEVYELKETNNKLALLPPSPLGRPELSAKKVQFLYRGQAFAVNKSVLLYYNTLAVKDKQIVELTNQIKAENDKQQELTEELLGKVDPKTKQVVRVGLHEVQSNEWKAREALKAEIKAIRPLWVRRLVDTELLSKRTERLQRRLAELERLGVAAQK